ncbi:MAG: tetratricopeptide repeat protein [Planctomycetota bacterium]
MRLRSLVAAASAITLAAVAVSKEESHRLRWKLPEGLSLQYVCEQRSEGSGPTGMKGLVSFKLSIRVPRKGTALVDTSLDKLSMSMGGRQMPQNPAAAQSFEVHTLLDEKKGFDPEGVLARQQRNLFETLFPLPPKELVVGHEWPLRIKMVSPGSLGVPSESNVGVLKAVRREGGSNIAALVFTSKVSLTTQGGGGTGPSAMKMTLSGNADFDLSKGRFAKNEMSTTMSMPSGGMPGPGGPSGGMTMKSFTKVSLDDADPLPPDEVKKLLGRLKVREAVHRAVTLAKAGKNDEALEALGKVMESEFHDEHVPLIAVQIHARLGDWKKAKDALDRELARFPDSIQALMLARVVYGRAGEPAKAKAAERKMQEALGAGGP